MAIAFYLTRIGDFIELDKAMQLASGKYSEAVTLCFGSRKRNISFPVALVWNSRYECSVDHDPKIAKYHCWYPGLKT